MAYNESIQSTDSQEIKHLELMKEIKGRAVDSSTLSVVYLLSDSTQKAANTARQALGASAPRSVPSNLPGLKGAKKQELQKDPNPGPSPSGDTVKTISFRALFSIMMKLMTSQENAQSRDADTGSKLSDQETDVITNMASSLSKYYNSVIAPAAKDSKTDISAKSAQLNLYKSEWDNFKDQIDGQVQNLSNAAGTTDVNNIQQTTDFEKDVLQTWGNVANQIAAL